MRHPRGGNAGALAIAVAVAAVVPGRSLAWDSGTHRLSLASRWGAPKSIPRTFFEANIDRLQQYSKHLDTKLRERYVAETRRYYLDIEVYNSDWSALIPDRAAMVRRYGYRTLDRSGTLPWTIEQVAKHRNATGRAETAKPCCASAGISRTISATPRSRSI